MGNGPLGKGRLKELVKKKPFLISVGVVVLVTLVLGVFFVLKSLSVVDTPALRIGEVEVSQSDFDKYVELGKSRGMSKAEVRNIVVEYEKNLQMAEKFDVKIPKDYVKYAKNEYQATDVGIQARGEGDSRDNLLTNAQDYNHIFDSRVSQASQSGYGVFVYEFGVVGSANESTLDDRLEEARKVANRYKSRITEDKENPADVLDDVVRYNAQEGQTVHSGFYFVPDIEYPGFSESEKYVTSPPYLLSILKKSSEDALKVRQSDDRSYFFMYISFQQDSRDDVSEKINSAKEGIRVVIYDK